MTIMLRKTLLYLAFVLYSTLSFAQTGTLQGTIIDAMTNEPIPFANVVLTKNGNQSAGTTTDFDGKYTIKPIDPGTYNIKATFVGYQTKEITGVEHDDYHTPRDDYDKINFEGMQKILLFVTNLIKN